MKIVEKWVAGFFAGKLYVVKWKFRETPKTFIMVKEDCSAYYDAQSAVNYSDVFRKSRESQERRLFDTSEEAFDSLYQGELKIIQGHQNQINRILDRMSIMDNFSEKDKT